MVLNRDISLLLVGPNCPIWDKFGTKGVPVTKSKCLANFTSQLMSQIQTFRHNLPNMVPKRDISLLLIGPNCPIWDKFWTMIVPVTQSWCLATLTSHLMSHIHSFKPNLPNMVLNRDISLLLVGPNCSIWDKFGTIIVQVPQSWCLKAYLSILISTIYTFRLNFPNTVQNRDISLFLSGPNGPNLGKFGSLTPQFSQSWCLIYLGTQIMIILLSFNPMST